MKRKFYFQPNSIIVWDFFFEVGNPDSEKACWGFSLFDCIQKLQNIFKMSVESYGLTSEKWLVAESFLELSNSPLRVCWRFQLTKFGYMFILPLSWNPSKCPTPARKHQLAVNQWKTFTSGGKGLRLFSRWIFTLFEFLLNFSFEFFFWKLIVQSLFLQNKKNGNWKFFTVKVHGNLKGAQSRYFELFWQRTKLPWNWRKPENNSSLRQKNTKEITINRKGTRMVKDGED